MKVIFILLAMSAITSCGLLKDDDSEIDTYENPVDSMNRSYDQSVDEGYVSSDYDNFIPDLLNCSTCGHKIAKNANSCVGCGAPGRSTLNAYRLRIKAEVEKREKEEKMKEWASRKEGFKCKSCGIKALRNQMIVGKYGTWYSICENCGEEGDYHWEHTDITPLQF